jgi:hypothetical protein
VMGRYVVDGVLGGVVGEGGHGARVYLTPALSQGAREPPVVAAYGMPVKRSVTEPSSPGLSAATTTQ